MKRRALYPSTGMGNPVLPYLSIPSGRAVKNGTAWSYEHFLADHPGNVRVVFGDGNADGTADVVQDNAYYPFGMTLDGWNFSFFTFHFSLTTLLFFSLHYQPIKRIKYPCTTMNET